jgi:hypothetical protein
MEQNGLFAQVNDSIRTLASQGSAAQTWEFISSAPRSRVTHWSASR